MLSQCEATKAAAAAMMSALLWTSVASAQSLRYIESIPSVVSSATRGDVRIEATNIGSATRVVLSRELRGTSRVDLDFRDDGAGGDRVAGDNVYTLSVAATSIMAALVPNDVQRVNVGFIRVLSGATEVVTGAVQVDVYSPPVPVAPIYRLTPGVQMTEHLVNIHDPQFHSDLDVNRVMATFYTLFADDYDQFNVIWLPSRPGNNRTHAVLRSDAAGIGLASPAPGDARLKGLNRFPVAYIFDGATQGYTHEVGHQWIEYAHFAPFDHGSPGLHWPISSMASGVMGFSSAIGAVGSHLQCRVVVEPDGTVRLMPKPNYLGFTDFDLYLMGLMAPGEAGDQVIFNDQSTTLLQQLASTCDGRISPFPSTRVTVQELVSGLGPRIPDASASRRQFKIATVIVSRDGLLPPEAMWLYDWLSARAESQAVVPTHEAYHFIGTPGMPFFVATRGRASLDTRMSPVLPLPPPITPAAPGNLQATVTGADVTLSWNAAPAATSYRVIVGSHPGGSDLVNLDLGNATSLGAGAVPVGTYFVRVHAVLASAVSPPSTELTLTLGPQPPANLQATASGSTVTVQWSPAPGAISYRLAAGSAPGASNVFSGNVGPATSLTAGGVPPGQYYLRVHGVQGAVESGPSIEALVSVGGCSAPVPTALTSVVQGAAVSLSWTPVSGATGYALEAGSSPGAANLLVLPVAGVSFSATAPPGTYFVRVRALSACGASQPSNEVTVSIPSL